jgi:hypothetical protein
MMFVFSPEQHHSPVPLAREGVDRLARGAGWVYAAQWKEALLHEPLHFR